MFRRFRNSEGGNFAVITGIMTVPLMAAVAGIVDFTTVHNKTGQLQNSLDSSALAIATAYDLGMSDDELTQLGQDYYDHNMVGIVTNVDAYNYDDQLSSDLSAIASSEGDEEFITVRSNITHQGILGALNWPVHRRSVVKIKRGAPACVLALDPHAASSVKIQGSTDIGLQGCVIASNSNSDSAVYRGGSAVLSAACINTVGATSGISSNSNTHLDCPAPLENQYPSFDPLAKVVPPSYSCPGKSVPGGKQKTLEAGTYCNKTLSGEITLEPGTYVLAGGRISLGGNGYLKGAGVTIFLMGDAEFSVNGNEIVQLTPPSSGDYAGITIFQEKSNTNTITINGTSDSYISGFVYAPGGHVFYAGNSEATTQSECLRIVGKTIEMTGNSDIKSDCTAQLGGREMFAGRYMSIVR